jgi:hypothetical protein
MRPMGHQFDSNCALARYPGRRHAGIPALAFDRPIRTSNRALPRPLHVVSFSISLFLVVSPYPFRKSTSKRICKKWRAFA